MNISYPLIRTRRICRILISLKSHSIPPVCFDYGHKKWAPLETSPQLFSEFTFKKYIFLSLGVMTQVSIWKFYRQLTLLKKQKQCSTRTYITVIIKNHVCVNDNTILLCRCCFCLLIKIVWVSSALIILDVAFSQNNFTKTTIPV